MLQRSQDTAYLTNIGIWVNFAHDYLYNIYDYWQELQAVYNFTTVSGTEDYFMPSDLGKPNRVYDLTNNKKLNPLIEEEYFDGNIANIANATTGKPSYFRIFGLTGIRGAIASAGTTLKIKSSSASDTAGVVVRIEGYIDSAFTILDFENITISTTTPTTFVAGTKTFYKVIHISKSADTTGYITVANSASTTVATLTSIDRVLYHKIMKLGLIPNAVISMRVLFKRKVHKLVNDNDYPFVDADDFITLYAAAFGYAQSKEGMDYATTLWAKSEKALSAILINNQTKLGADYQHKIIPSIARAHRA